MPERDSYAQGTPSWADLATRDDDAAVAFYSALFGWQDQPNPAGPGLTYHMMVHHGRPAAAIFKQNAEQAGQDTPPIWNTYITVADVDGATSRVRAAGGKVHAEPFDVFEFGRMSVIEDPTGAAVSFWQAKNHPGAGIVNEPGALCWNELQTHDLERAAAFLTEVLGVDVQKLDGPMDYGMIRVGGEPVGGILQMTAEEIAAVPTHWSVYFATADRAATVEKVRALGGTVIREEDLEVGAMAVLADPQGAVFQVIQRAESSD